MHILLNYRRDELPASARAGSLPDAALILPNFAETFSYTLSELISFGIPAIATRLGALAERIHDGVDGFLVAPTAVEILATVAHLRANRVALTDARSALARVPTRTLDDMLRDYRGLLPRPARTYARHAIGNASLDRIAAQAYAGQLGDAQRLASAQREEIGGHLAELERRAEWGISLERDVRQTRKAFESAQGELERLGTVHSELQADFEERTQWALALDAQREELEGELATLRGSLSWRITRPLRYAMRKLRAARVRLGFALTSAAQIR